MERYSAMPTSSDYFLCPCMTFLLQRIRHDTSHMRVLGEKRGWCHTLGCCSLCPQLWLPLFSAPHNSSSLPDLITETPPISSPATLWPASGFQNPDGTSFTHCCWILGFLFEVLCVTWNLDSIANHIIHSNSDVSVPYMEKLETISQITVHNNIMVTLYLPST